MTTTEALKNENSSSESVVSLSYSEVISFKEVKLEVVEDKSTDENIDESVEESTDESSQGSIEELYEEAFETQAHQEKEVLDVHEALEPLELVETIENSVSSVEEIIHFPSPAPLQSGTASTTSNYSSWTDTIEALLDQLNDIDFDSDYERDILLKRGLKEPGQVSEDEQVIEQDDEERVINELRTGQGFLLCLAVPVLLSQILMLLILSSTTSDAKSSIIVRPIGHIQTIHYHHHHHHYYYHEDKKPSNSRFAYVFFNPFGAICNNRYFKTTFAWISKEYQNQLNDPSSLISQLSHYIALYLNSIKSRVLKLNDVMRSGLDNEIGKALRVRDNWNRAVYDKIYKIASKPQYQRVVSTVSKWASAIKDRLFHSN